MPRDVLRVRTRRYYLHLPRRDAGGMRSPRGTMYVLRDVCCLRKHVVEGRYTVRGLREKFVANSQNGSMVIYPRLALAIVSAKERRSFCFARDKLFYATTAGSKQYVVTQRTDLYYILRRSTAPMQCYYEVLDATLPSRFYMDIEFARPSIDDGSTIEANLKQYFPRESESALVSGCEQRCNIVQP